MVKHAMTVVKNVRMAPIQKYPASETYQQMHAMFNSQSVRCFLHLQPAYCPAIYRRMCKPTCLSHNTSTPIVLTPAKKIPMKNPNGAIAP